MTDLGLPMHQTTVAKIETGSRPTSIREAEALSVIFGMDMVSLLVDADPELAAARLEVVRLLGELDALRAEMLRVEASRVELEHREARTMELLSDAATHVQRLERARGEHPEAP